MLRPESDLYQLFARFDSETFHLDADEPAEHHLLMDRAGRPPGLVLKRTTEQLERLLCAYSGDDHALESALPIKTDLPVGGSAQAWCEYLLGLMPKIVAHPERFLDRRRFPAPLLPRVSKFDGPDAADAAFRRMVLMNADRIEEFQRRPRGHHRLHLYADVGQRIGDVLLNVPEGRPKPEYVPVSACVLLFRITPFEREFVVENCYPEIELPTAPRDRFPDLTGIIGGYFNQDFDASDESRIGAERSLNMHLREPTRSAVAAQLHALLTEDDDTMRASVSSLGSYVVPSSIRRWVTGLHRRMTEVDWRVPG